MTTGEAQSQLRAAHWCTARFRACAKHHDSARRPRWALAWRSWRIAVHSKDCSRRSPESSSPLLRCLTVVYQLARDGREYRSTRRDWSPDDSVHERVRSSRHRASDGPSVLCVPEHREDAASLVCLAAGRQARIPDQNRIGYQRWTLELDQRHHVLWPAVRDDADRLAVAVRFFVPAGLIYPSLSASSCSRGGRRGRLLRLASGSSRWVFWFRPTSFLNILRR